MTEPGIAYAVGASLEVYLDSGVRWGMDVLKRACVRCQGGPRRSAPLLGLAVDGEAGVRTALEILRMEFDRAMACCSRTRLSEIDRSLVNLPCDYWTRR